jgi:hypothetical protein
MLFLCSIFFVLCPQWVNGHGFVEPRPSRSYHHSSECFPEATHGMSSWNTSGGEFHGCYPHRVSMISMIYWWYPDVSLNFHKIWREITWNQHIWMSEIFHGSPGYPLPRRKARGKPRLHRPPATETCLELGETRLDQHFPHEFVWKLRLKHVKTQIWWSIMFFPLIDCYLEGISYFPTQLNGWWFMNCFTMFHMFHGGSFV